MKFRINAFVDVTTKPKIEPDDLMSSVEATFGSIFEDEFVLNDLIDSVDGFADRDVNEVNLNVIDVSVEPL